MTSSEERLAVLETRIDGIDKATTIFEQNLTRIPTEVDSKVANLKELHASAFLHYEAYTKLSIETFTTALSQLDNLVDTKTNALEQRVFDLKDRVAAIENQAKGRNDGWIWVIAGLGVVFGFGALIVPIFLR